MRHKRMRQESSKEIGAQINKKHKKRSFFEIIFHSFHVFGVLVLTLFTRDRKKVHIRHCSVVAVCSPALLSTFNSIQQLGYTEHSADASTAVSNIVCLTVFQTELLFQTDGLY
jgi:hypothetical protein